MAARNEFKEYINGLRLGKKETDCIINEIKSWEESDAKKLAIDTLCKLNKECFANLMETNKLSKEDFRSRLKMFEQNKDSSSTQNKPKSKEEKNNAPNKDQDK